MQCCVGFTDASRMKICRPGGHALTQRAAYSGHRGFHCLNFQTIAGPDSIILRPFGPLEGRRHDSTIYRRSGIDDDLGSALMIDGQQHCAYGDPAFPHMPWLQLGYRRPAFDEGRQLLNASMNSAKICAEWRYKEAKQNFSAIDFSRKMKKREPPISLLRISAALLLNFKICLGRGSQAARCFCCKPPSAREYLDS